MGAGRSHSRRSSQSVSGICDFSLWKSHKSQEQFIFFRVISSAWALRVSPFSPHAFLQRKPGPSWKVAGWAEPPIGLLAPCTEERARPPDWGRGVGSTSERAKRATP